MSIPLHTDRDDSHVVPAGQIPLRAPRPLDEVLDDEGQFELRLDQLANNGRFRVVDER